MVDRLDALIGKSVGEKTFWTKVGAAFKNRNGGGYTLVLDAIPASVDGQFRISLFEPKDNNDRGSNNNSGSGYQNNKSGGNGGSSSGRPGSNRGQSQDDYGSSKPDHGQDDDIPF